MRITPLIAAGLLAALAAPAAAGANEGFAAITSNGRLATFSEQSQPYLLSLNPVSAATRHARIVALDRLPAGGLLALDAEGRIFDLDVAKSRLTPRFGGRAVAGAVESASTITFTVAKDGASVLVINRDVARRVDLATGEAHPVAQPTTGGTQQSLAVDTLPDGRLFGIEGGSHAVVAEQEPGSGRLTTVAPLNGNVIRQTRFTLSADGATGWVVTRLSARTTGTPQSRWLQVNPQTGAATGKNGPFFLRAFDAVAATGDASEITSAPRAHVTLPRTVSRRQLARARGLDFMVRSNQGGQTVVSLRDEANKFRGFGFGTQDVPNRAFKVHVSSTPSDQRRLGSRFRVHIAVHGIGPNSVVRTIDRWVHVTR